MPANSAPTTKAKTKPSGLRLWALRLALVGLVFQALMPVTNALAAYNINKNGAVTGNAFVLCTQFGIQIKSIAPDGGPSSQPTGVPKAKSLWDCPICQLQLGSDTPKPLAFTFAANMGEKSNIAIPSGDLPTNAHCLRPNQPRAPPAA